MMWWKQPFLRSSRQQRSSRFAARQAASSTNGGGNGDRRRAIEVIARSGPAPRSGAALGRPFRATPRPMILRAVAINRHLDSCQARPQHSLTMVKFDGTHNKRGSHDGLYPATVYWHHRRRLLRRVRQSSGCSAIRSNSTSGFGQTQYRLYAATVPRHPRRWLLQRLRQCSGCSSIHFHSGRGFSRVIHFCRRTWPNSSPGATTRFCAC
jgi:hypothetical protein